jgi:hypothetical protein
MHEPASSSSGYTRLLAMIISMPQAATPPNLTVPCCAEAARSRSSTGLLVRTSDSGDLQVTCSGT